MSEEAIALKVINKINNRLKFFIKEFKHSIKFKLLKKQVYAFLLAVR